jgi:hypothetical protein
MAARMSAKGDCYVALDPVDIRWGYERLGGMVRERMQAEPKSRTLFAFVGNRLRRCALGRGQEN